MNAWFFLACHFSLLYPMLYFIVNSGRLSCPNTISLKIKYIFIQYVDMCVCVCSMCLCVCVCGVWVCVCAFVCHVCVPACVVVCVCVCGVCLCVYVCHGIQVEVRQQFRESVLFLPCGSTGLTQNVRLGGRHLFTHFCHPLTVISLSLERTEFAFLSWAHFPLCLYPWNFLIFLLVTFIV